jgi:hypothetical protein
MRHYLDFEKNWNHLKEGYEIERFYDIKDSHYARETGILEKIAKLERNLRQSCKLAEITAFKAP